MPVSVIWTSSILKPWIRQKYCTCVSTHSHHLRFVQTPQSRSNYTYVVVGMSFQSSILCRLSSRENTTEDCLIRRASQQWIKFDVGIIVFEFFQLLSRTKTYCGTVRDELKSFDKFTQEAILRKDAFGRILFLVIFCKYQYYLSNMLSENFLSIFENWGGVRMDRKRRKPRCCIGGRMSAKRLFSQNLYAKKKISNSWVGGREEGDHWYLELHSSHLCFHDIHS